MRKNRSGLIMAAMAATMVSTLANGEPLPPSTLEQALVIREPSEPLLETTNMRMTAIREAWLRHGAQAGLARRTWEIRKYLDREKPLLDEVFDIDSLAISGPAGFAVLPPVVTESGETVEVAEDGFSARQTWKQYRLAAPARLVSLAPTWRTYLVREWAEVSLPPAVLHPRNAEERRSAETALKDGWQAGVQQAGVTFAADLALLERDVRGFIAYRELVERGVVQEIFIAASRPEIEKVGRTLEIGRRSVRITQQADFRVGDDWLPVMLR